jgi:hypothetical protein
MKSKILTENCFCVSELIDRQLLSMKNCKLLFPYLGKQIVENIIERKLIIPEGNFIAHIYVQFVEEKKFVKQARELGYMKDK